jgi:carboxyl-terminal processing protease
MRGPLLPVVGAATFAAFAAGLAAGRRATLPTDDPWAAGGVVVPALDSVRVNALQALPDDELIRRAVAGMLRELDDPYATVLDAEGVRRYRGAQHGDVRGYGVTLRRSGGTVWVTRVTRGSPASVAGVQAGDRVLTVNGEPADEGLGRARGDSAAPDTLALRLVHAGRRDTVAVLLRRTTWRQPAVGDVALLGDAVGYVQLQAVPADAAEEVESAVSALRARGATALVLDLRGNTGGLFEEGVRIASLFLPRGTLVASLAGREGDVPREFRARRPRFEEMPVAVLVDGRTASAAEIVAAALREQRGAPLVGAPTFGKGVVQRVVRLAPELSVRLTTSRWFTPSGVMLRREAGPDGAVTGGLVPDRPVADAARPELFAWPASWPAAAVARAEWLADTVAMRLAERAATRVATGDGATGDVTAGDVAATAGGAVDVAERLSEQARAEAQRVAVSAVPRRVVSGVSRDEVVAEVARVAAARVLGAQRDPELLLRHAARHDAALRTAVAALRPAPAADGAAESATPARAGTVAPPRP